MITTDTHVYFWSGPFSQWHNSTFSYAGKTYNCAEQFMMASKAAKFGDWSAHAEIMKSRDPSIQKALGRKVRNFNEQEWSAVAQTIVVLGNIAKFEQNPKLKDVLIDSGTRTIVEGSPYDRNWGVGIKFDDPKILDEKNWQGQNLLGKALMQVRSYLVYGEILG